MRLCYCIILLSLSVTQTSNAQSNQNQHLINDPANVATLTHGGIYYTTNRAATPGVEGTPYLFDWLPADIVKTNGDTVKGYSVSYDASKDVFELKLLSQIKILDAARVSAIKLQDRTFVSIQNGFYELLSGGKFMFLRKYKAVIDRAHYNAALNSGSKADQWNMQQDYFVKNNGEIVKVKLNKRSILKAIGLSEDELTKKISSSPDFSSEQHIKEIFDLLGRD